MGKLIMGNERKERETLPFRMLNCLKSFQNSRNITHYAASVLTPQGKQGKQR